MAKIKEQFQDDRTEIEREQDILNQIDKDVIGKAEDRYDHTTGLGDEINEANVAGRGGYDATEIDDIVREGELRGIKTTDQELEDNYLTPDEEAAIMGDPDSRSEYFNPEFDIQRNYDKERQTDAIKNKMSSNLYGAIDEGLSPQAGYYDQMDEAVSGTEDWLEGKADSGALRASEGTLDDIRMSPEEEAQMVAASGKTAGNAYRAQLQQVDRASRAAGSSPDGVAARRMRYTRQSAVDAADASTNAAIAASNARSGRAGQAEYIRQSGEGAATDLATRQGFGIGDMQLNKTQAAEELRLNSAQDVSNRLMDTAQLVGQTGIKDKMDHLESQKQQRQFSTTTGTGINTGIDRDNSANAGVVAGNRQSINLDNQGTKYDQGLTQNQTLSNRRKGVADVGLDADREGRAYVADQQAGATNRGQVSRAGRGRTFSTATAGRGAGTANAAVYDRTPGRGERVAVAGLEAAGNIFSIGD